MSETPMLSGTGRLSTWTGKDPADRSPDESFDDNIAHEPRTCGGVSTWEGTDPAEVDDPAPTADPPTPLHAPTDPPADPPADPPTE